jgi:hypothetical protein
MQQLKAGSSLLAATDDAAKGWQTHYGAQLAYSAHKITQAKTLELFASSKAAGFGQVKRYAAASADYRKAGTGCSSLTTAVPATQMAAAKVCVAQASAQDAAISSGAKVAGQWAEHIHMMTSTMNHGTHSYLSKWYSMVKAAPPAMKTYHDDLATYTKTPACSAPKA